MGSILLLMNNKYEYANCPVSGNQNEKLVLTILIRRDSLLITQTVILMVAQGERSPKSVGLILLGPGMSVQN